MADSAAVRQKRYRHKHPERVRAQVRRYYHDPANAAQTLRRLMAKQLRDHRSRLRQLDQEV